jgi:DNA-binding IscR family transcriptional regulator
MKTLSRKARYALRALYALADDQSHAPVLSADRAAREGIPHKLLLELIRLGLRKPGILGQGPGGHVIYGG